MRFRSAVPLIAILALTVSACGGRANTAAAKAAVEVDSRIVAGFETFDAPLDARCDSDQIPAEACKIINRFSVPFYDAALALNTQLQDGRPLEQLGPLVDAFRTAGANLRAEVEKLTPAQGRDILLDVLGRLISRYIPTE